MKIKLWATFFAASAGVVPRSMRAGRRAAEAAQPGVAAMRMSARHFLIPPYLLLLGGMLLPVRLHADENRRYYDAFVGPEAGDHLASADYRLWLPPGVQTVRGVLVRQHGCGAGATSYGLDHAHDVQWQALARKHGLALLGTRLIPRNGCRDWTDPVRGSEKAFLKALADLAQQTGHPELTRAPWILTGHSGGAFWTTALLLRHPQRIAAAVPLRGRLLSQVGGPVAGSVKELDAALAAATSNVSLHAVAKVPVLFAVGANDKIINGTNDVRLGFNRPADAAWTLAVNPVAGHELANTRQFALPYLDAVLAQRLPQTPGEPLRPLDPARAWLGDPQMFTIAPAERFTGDKAKAAWLPDETVARYWKEYVSSGKVAPAPAAPTNVRAVRVSSTEVELTWDANVDANNPVPSFHVYRNQARIGTLLAPSHGYGDNPQPALWNFFFRDTNAPARDDMVYQVRAVGGSEPGAFESAKSAPANVTMPLPSASRADLPDLVVTDIALVPANPEPGEAVGIRATIKNVGTRATPTGAVLGVTLRVDGQRVVGPLHRVPLAPNKSVTLDAVAVSNQPVWKAIRGSHMVVAEVDDLDRVAERDETNNALRRTWTIGPDAVD